MSLTEQNIQQNLAPYITRANQTEQNAGILAQVHSESLLGMAKHSKPSCGFSLFSSLFICLQFVNTDGALTANNKTDMLALLSFKAAIDDDPLGALSSWNETVQLCSWRGVTCSQRHVNRVVSINLRSRGLVGSVSSHIGNLSFLRSITLQNNTFRGQIPEEIGRLRRLEYAEFSNNSFTGEIPRNITQCRNLYYLNLNGNNIGGSIFPELASLSKLEALGLSLNMLSGTIPSAIGNLTALKTLSIGTCSLVGEIPDSFVQLKNLQFIQLTENNFTGSIPSGLFNISTISFFSVRSNQLQGTIPPDVAFTLPNLRYLDLSDNLFSGEILASLPNASSLEAINLSSNFFSGPFVTNFERLTNLQNFAVADNNFRGDFSFISSMTNCTRLQVLGLGQNHLNGSLPDAIANLSSRLSFIAMDMNQMYGSIPPGIANLVNLTTLSLSYNYLSGSIPSSIGKLTKLQELYLDVNGFSNEIPPALGNLTMLNSLSLANNRISGSIPQSFSNYNSLLDLDLSHNNLSGGIPIEVLSLSSVSISLNLAYNAFTGSIPSEVGLLKNLDDLDLSNNRISGYIPSSLSSCVLLQRLHLEGNSLEGEIPEGLDALRGLLDLDLSRNQLSGRVPSFLSELHLTNLNLSFNALQGEVPVSGVFQNESAVSVNGNSDLCGGIAQLKLTPCPSTNPKKGNFPTVLVATLVPSVVTVVITVIFVVFVYMKRKTPGRSNISVPSLKDQFTRLSYGNLLKATDRFSEANLIGAGRFGSVYRGTLDDGVTVAVKVLKLDVKGASKCFMAECNALSGARHRNILKILSVCSSIDSQGRDFKALIFQYKSNGSLDKWLHQNADEGRRNLTLIHRLNIAIDIAYALEYLHSNTDSILVHGDVKPSNILLDENMTAHVGDFGLARVISSLSGDSAGPESNSTAIKGTVGYIPPEYGMWGNVSAQGDAYGYGILLLELFTNIRPTNNALLGHSDLHSFVKNALPDKIFDILDPYIMQETFLNNQKITEFIVCVLSIGVACSEELPRYRMEMRDVVTELNKVRRGYFDLLSSGVNK